MTNAVRDLEALYAKTKDRLGNAYGGTNIHEFLAELANREFMQRLKGINLFEGIVNAIKNILRVLSRRSTAHGEALNILNRFLDNADNFAFDAVRQYSKVYGSEFFELNYAPLTKFLDWAKKWKLDQSKEKVRKEWQKKNDVLFDSSELDVDVFQKRAGAVMALAKAYKDNGVGEFKTLATRLAERYPDKFGGMKPHLRGIWNYIAEVDF